MLFYPQGLFKYSSAWSYKFDLLSPPPSELSPVTKNSKHCREMKNFLVRVTNINAMDFNKNTQFEFRMDCSIHDSMRSEIPKNKLSLMHMVMLT